MAYIKANFDDIQNGLLQLSADYDDDDMLEYALFIDNDTRGLGDRALDLLIFGVKGIWDDPKRDALSYMHLYKLCEYVCSVCVK
jgi:hypothetical protein